MPRVPMQDNFSVAPEALRPVGLDAGASRVDVGAEGRALGQATERAGDTALAIENDQLRMANQIRVDDAMNKALEAENRLAYDPQTGFTQQKGIAALERQSGKPLADEYTEALGKEQQGIAASLGNDWQRRQFQAEAGRRLAGFRAAAMRHESQEFQTYTLSVRDGTISNRMQQIGLNYNHPEVIDEALTSIKAATYDIGRLQGKSAEWTEAQARKMTSNAMKVAIGTAIEKNDIAYADQLVKRFKDHMDADDMLQASGLITKEMDLRVGVSTATDVMAKVAPKIVTSDFDRLVNITMATESGGRRFGPDGKLLTSTAGARGEMQVMDRTNRNPGFGVKPAADDSPEERARVGRDYLAAMVKNYDGDLAKAWAAYNGGPGAVDKAMKTAQKMTEMSARDPSLPAPKSWLELMPQETQQYVATNMKAYGNGQGQSPKPTMAEIDAQLQANPVLAGNPERLKAARAEAKRQFDQIEAARKQRGEEGEAGAMRELLANGGNFAALSPTTRAQVPTDKIDSVMAFGEKVRKGEDTTSLWLYNKLESNPSYLASLSDDGFFALRKELSDADFKHFSDARAKALGRTIGGANGPGELNSQAIRDGLGNRLAQLGIDPTPKDGQQDAIRVGGIRQFVNQYMLTAQKEAGKKFTDAEVAQHLDGLFAKNATLRGWFSTESSGPMLTQRPGDLPKAARTQILDAYKRRGVDNPTEAQIMTAYWTAQSVTR